MFLSRLNIKSFTHMLCVVFCGQPVSKTMWLNIECTPWEKRGAEKKMALGARFQKLMGGLTISKGLNSQRGLDSRVLPCFSANMLFFCNIVIYSYHCVYSNIFNIAESLTQNNYLADLAMQPSNIVLVGRPVVRVALLSTFLAVQYL